MPGKKWSLVVLAILVAASSTYTFSQAAIQSRKLPLSALQKMKPMSDHASDSMAKFGAQKSQRFGAAGISVHAAASSGVPGIGPSRPCRPSRPRTLASGGGCP